MLNFKINLKQQIVWNIFKHLLIVGAIFYWFIFPSFVKIIFLKEQFLLASSELGNKKLYSLSAPSAKGELQITKEKLNEIKAIFPKIGEENILIAQLQGLAKQQDLDVRIEFSAPKDFPNCPMYKELDLIISASGRFSDQLNYLSAIKNLPYYLNFIKLDFNKNYSSEKNIVNSKFQAKLFLKKLDSEFNNCR